MLTSKIIRGMTTFRKVKPDVIEMVIIDPANNVHIQTRKLCGSIEYENTHALGERSTALSFCVGFFGIPATL